MTVFDEYMKKLKSKKPGKRVFDNEVREDLQQENISLEVFMEYVRRRVLNNKPEPILHFFSHTIASLEDIGFLKEFMQVYPAFFDLERVKWMFSVENPPISENVAKYLLEHNMVIESSIMLYVVIYPDILHDLLLRNVRMNATGGLRDILLKCLRNDKRESFRMIIQYHDFENYLKNEIIEPLLDEMNQEDINIMNRVKPDLLTVRVKLGYLLSAERLKNRKMYIRFLNEVQLEFPRARKVLCDALFWGDREDVALIILERYPGAIDMETIVYTLDLFTNACNNKNTAYKHDRYLTREEYGRVFESMIKKAREHTNVLDDVQLRRLIRPSLNLIKQASRDGNSRACEILIKFSRRDPAESRSAWIRWAGKKGQYEMIDRLFNSFPKTDHFQVLQWASGKLRNPITGKITYHNLDTKRISELFMVLSISRAIRVATSGPHDHSMRGIVSLEEYPDIQDRVRAGQQELIDRERSLVLSLLTATGKIQSADLIRRIIEYNDSEETLLLRVFAYYGDRISRLVHIISETQHRLKTENVGILKRRAEQDEYHPKILDTIRKVQDSLN